MTAFGRVAAAFAVWLLLVAPAMAQRLDLSGAHPTMAGDDPAWADPAFDDGAWPRRAAPSLGDWARKSGDPYGDVMWIRIRFDAPAALAGRELAFHAGVFRGGDRVFLNGMRIGATASFDVPALSEFATASAAWPRVYPLPPGLLRFDGPNLLAIRVARSPMADAGVLAGPLEIAPFGATAAEASKQAAPFLLGAALLLAIDVATVLGLLAALPLGWRDRAIRWLAATVLICYAPGALLLSLPARLIELVENPWIEFYMVKLMGLAVAPLAEFVAAALGRPVGRAARTLQAAHVLLFLTPPLAALGEGVQVAVLLLWLAAVIALFAILVFWGVEAIRRGVRAAWPLFVGVAAIFAGIVAAQFVSENAAVAAIGGTPTDWAMRVFLLSLGVMALLRYLDVQRRLNEARAHVLTAHESERRRLARDVHDSVGQWLSTIKLSVMMLRREQRGTAAEAGLGEMAGFIDEAISDARRIAHDLSPALIERAGLAAAMRSHADHVSGRGGPEIVVEVRDLPALSMVDQGQLYRIFQEALRNATVHGRARTVRATLAGQGGGVRFAVDDDGIGFDPKTVTGGGIGLTSIRERADLLGAACEISARPGGGCRIELRFKPRRSG